MKKSIIIPTLNESENICSLLDVLHELFPKGDMEFIVVDDNSPDGTAEKVNEYGKSHSDTKCILNDGQPGLSPSVIKGFESAEGELLCCMDGDFQHEPKSIPGLFEIAEKNNLDMLAGTRFAEGGGFSEKWSSARLFVSKTASFMTRLILGIKISDPMSGCFLIRKDKFCRVRNRLNPSGFKVMLELFYAISKTDGDNANFAEKGIIFNNRRHGQSKLSAKVIIQFIKSLFQMRKN